MMMLVVLLVTVAAAVHSNEGQEAKVLNYDAQDSHHIIDADEMGRTSRRQWGSVGPDDRLISTTIHTMEALSFFINYQEVTYRGLENTNITMIRTTEPWGSTEVVLLDGGLYHNFVTLGFKSARSSSMTNMAIDIFATINCSNN
uniref:SFRICE_006014 n=1 Tax=Spodoptera frugiperda TaxID=7108 RepID=A0A2H1VN40_SPOFR